MRVHITARQIRTKTIPIALLFFPFNKWTSLSCHVLTITFVHAHSLSARAPPPHSVRTQGIYPAARSLPESGEDTLVQAILNLDRGYEQMNECMRTCLATVWGIYVQCVCCTRLSHCNLLMLQSGEGRS